MQHLAAGACPLGHQAAAGEQPGLQLKRAALSKAELTSCFKHARLSSTHGSSRIVAPARRMVLLDVVHVGGSQGGGSSVLHYFSGTQESLSQQASFGQQVSFDSSQGTGVDMRAIFPGAAAAVQGRVSPGSPAGKPAAAEADAPAVRTPARAAKPSSGSRGSSGQSTPVRGTGLGARSVALKAVFGSQHLSVKRSTSSKTKSSSSSSRRNGGGSSRLSNGSQGATQAAGLQGAASSIDPCSSGAAMRAALSALSISSTRRERRVGKALAGLLTTQLSRRAAAPTSALLMTVAQAAQVLKAAATSPDARPADIGCQDPATITLAGVMAAAAAAGVAGRSQA